MADGTGAVTFARVPPAPYGRAWAPLAFTGRPETSADGLDDQCTQSLLLLPIGLTCVATDGSTWFGAPQS